MGTQNCEKGTQRGPKIVKKKGLNGDPNCKKGPKVVKRGNQRGPKIVKGNPKGPKIVKGNPKVVKGEIKGDPKL